MDLQAANFNIQNHLWMCSDMWELYAEVAGIGVEVRPSPSWTTPEFVMQQKGPPTSSLEYRPHEAQKAKVKFPKTEFTTGAEELFKRLNLGPAANRFPLAKPEIQGAKKVDSTSRPITPRNLGLNKELVKSFFFRIALI
ncbi:MAG: hypothetical protein Q9187_007032 [Circinaria calcarea]